MPASESEPSLIIVTIPAPAPGGPGVIHTVLQIAPGVDLAGLVSGWVESQEELRGIQNRWPRLIDWLQEQPGVAVADWEEFECEQEIKAAILKGIARGPTPLSHLRKRRPHR